MRGRLRLDYSDLETRCDASQLLVYSNVTTTTNVVDTLLVRDETRDARASAPSESEN